jgi:hypothetical protein
MFYGNLNGIFKVMKIRSLRILIAYTLEVLKCGAGEIWRRQIGPIV